MRRGQPGILLDHEQGMYHVWNVFSDSLTIFKHVVVVETVYPIKSYNKTENNERYNEEYCADVINLYEEQDTNYEMPGYENPGEESEIDTSNPSMC